jgi:hypothetical protein
VADPPAEGPHTQAEKSRSRAERLELLIGLLIVALSIAGAGVTWRAAAISGTATDLDQRARQAAIQAAEIQAENAAIVTFEERAFASFRDHHALADTLRRDGRLRRAQEERAAARAIDLLFVAARPRNAAGLPRYQRAEAQAYEDSDPRLSDLQPSELEAAAAVGREKRFLLVAVDTALIAAIFVSTLAMLIVAVRRWFAFAGLALGIVAAVGLIVVEATIRVPAP